jgi:hypothetical protein
MSYLRIMLIAGICLYGMGVQAGQQRTGAKQALPGKHVERAPYHVPFGSSGNRIELAILVGSMSVANIQVKGIEFPNSIHIDPAEQEVKNVQPNKAENVTFTFSVDKSAPLNKEYELIFLISTKGTQQRKTIPIVIDQPERFELFQNYPNPFNAVTVVSYLLPLDSHVSLKVYDVLGREVKVLADEGQEAGYKMVSFDAKELASGMYFYCITAHRKDGKTTFVKVNKLMIVK